MKFYLLEELSASIKQFIRKMRITCLLLFVLALGVFATPGSSQVAKVSINLKNATVAKVIDAIENQTDYLFVYSKNEIDLTREVSVEADQQPVAEVLSNLFDKTNILYAMEGTNIMLMLKSSAQQIGKNITGKVTDQSGASLPGVSVVIKGTTTGVITDSKGNYSLASIPENATLQFSFVGLKMQEVKVGNNNQINVVLEEETVSVTEVVVTALGIEKSSKSITYGMQKVAGDELNVVPQTNLMNSLSGKAAGVTISSAASGAGSSVKVLIRGNKSIQGYNQPLYVVDGVPLINNPNDYWGDGISNLNPDDIESMSVLKGASSAALYGSAAANGVILITTKKGKAGVSKVTFSSSYTMDKVAYIPKLQNSYGVTAPGSYESWGSAITNASDNISAFFKTGSTFVNAISFTSGTEKAQTYFSYANTTGNGVVPNNNLSRHNFDFHEAARFFQNKLSVDINCSLINQTIDNPANQIFNLLNTVYLFPRGVDMSPYKNNPTVFDPVRKLMVPNWYLPNNLLINNPYWMVNNYLSKNTRNRTIFKVVAKYDITNSLSFQIRGNVDKISDVSDNKTSARSFDNGLYSIGHSNTTLYYSDAMLNFAKSFGKINVKGVLGASIIDSHNDGMNASSSSLYIPNLFTIQNMDPTSGTTSYGSSVAAHSQLQAAFGDINLSYNDWLFLDITGRNDWSSNLSYTPNVSYFYPSAGVSTILNQVLKLPEVISLVKLRGSYAIVGNSVPLYVTNPQNHILRGGSIKFNTTAPFYDLNPEKTKSVELGTQIGLFDNQFSVDFSYYKTNSTNQFFSILVPPGTGYSTRFINAGNIQNSGVELTVGYSAITKRSFKWSTLINFSTNKNVVKSLANGIDQFVLAQDNNFFYSILKPGGSYGDIYGLTLQHDSVSGKVILDSNGAPLIKTGKPSLLGNPNPKFQLGWSNSFTYKNFTFSFLIDGKFGGKVVSQSQMILDGYGVSKASGDARANGGVVVNGMLADGTSVTKVDAYKWYNSIYSNKVNSEYMYDATFIKFREVSIGYSLPNTMFKNGFIKNIRFSLIGRNLAYLFKPAPFDPEVTASIGNGYIGIDQMTTMNLPATRSFGLNLNVIF